jgi:DNA repair protein RecO (recombination protein O)
VSVFTTRALLVAHAAARNADRVVTAITEDFGLLRLTARAARGSAAKLGGVLEPFALTVLTGAEGRHRPTAVGSVLEERFDALAKTPLGFGAAHVVVECASGILAERSGDARLFAQTLASFRSLNAAASTTAAPARVWWEAAKFVADLLSASGVGVALDHCARCGRRVGDGAGWSAGHGGLMHRAHAQAHRVTLDGAGVAVLGALARRETRPPPGSLLALVLLLREIQLHLGRLLTSVRFATEAGILPIPARLARLLYSS